MTGLTSTLTQSNSPLHYSIQFSIFYGAENLLVSLKVVDMLIF